MNRKITILGNSAAGAAAAAVLSKHNTVTVTMDPADCADAEYVLVSEYKRNFESLLCGSFATLSKACEGFTECAALGSIAVDMAENIINRIAHQAYGEGKKLVAE